jgi:serine protease Do
MVKGLVLAVMLVVAAAAPAWSQPAARAATIADASAALESAARVSAPAVVSIFTTSFATGQGRLTRAADLVATQRGAGSGVIVDSGGFIITNAHVVNGAHHLTVQLPSPAGGQSILGRRSRTVTGTVIGIDLETDLALIRVEESGLPAIQFADSDALRVGQLVLALGNPMGLEGSVSLGVVSAVARQLSADSPMIYVQTDASISPGSSGGALIDTKGRLAGINTLIVSHAGGSKGLGFAAPSNIVKAVYEQLKAHGRVRRGDIGVRAQTITPALASALALARQEGVILAEVLPGSPAQRAGLQAGDIVLALDGKPMENGRQLQVGLYRRFVGDIVTLDVVRDKVTMSLPVAMTERPDSWSGLPVNDPREHLVARLGILAVTLDRAIAEAVPVVRVRAGVLVASTVAGAIDARDDGLQTGDVIYAVNRMPVAAVADLRKALDRLRAGDPVVLHLERNGELRYVAFVIE